MRADRELVGQWYLGINRRNIFAPLALGGSESHADEREAGMAETVARLKAAYEAF